MLPSDCALRREQLHGELVVGTKLPQEVGIDSVGFVYGFAKFLLDHECLREIETHAQHIRTVGTAGRGQRSDQLACQSLGRRAIAQANIGERQTLLQVVTRDLIELRQGRGDVGSFLEISIR